MKEPAILDFPIPYYGQDETHREAYKELCYWYSVLLEKTPPEDYSEENYLTLFNALKDDIIIEKRKPLKCPKCGGKVAKILYGMPDFEYLESSKEEFIFGGCCMMEGDPAWQCEECDTQIYRESDLVES